MGEKEQALAEIEAIRAKIDEVDRRLVELLDERAGYSIDIRRLKPAAGMQLFDAGREQAIFDKVASYGDGTLHEPQLRELYETLLKVMKENPAD